MKENDKLDKYDYYAAGIFLSDDLPENITYKELFEVLPELDYWWPFEFYETKDMYKQITSTAQDLRETFNFKE